MNVKRVVVLLIVLLLAVPVFSQQKAPKTAVFVGQFQGPDDFINERFRLLFDRTDFLYQGE